MFSRCTMHCIIQCEQHFVIFKLYSGMLRTASRVKNKELMIWGFVYNCVPSWYTVMENEENET